MRIEEYKFGMFKIDGKGYLDDIKIINNKVRYWQDREAHLLKLENIKDLVEAKPDYIVIGTGASGFIEVGPEIKNFIEKNQIKLIIEKTDQACSTFNELIKQKRKVAAILHATC